MSINDQFLEFYKNIKLTSSQREDAKTKHNGVCKKLHGVYYPDITYSGATKLLIGSYAKHTHIRPARDVDVIFMMPSDKFDQYYDNQSNGPSQLLQDIKKILEEKYPDTPIKASEKVVVLEFAETQHNVELLPAWEREDNTFTIPNSKKGGFWENWDPRSEIKAIEISDAKTGKTRSLIRMAKKWSENCSVKLKSYQIEKKVLGFFSSFSSFEDEFSFLVRDFFDYFYQSANNEAIKSHLNTAYSRAKKACDFEKEKLLEKAIEEWRKIFGDDFPATLEEKIAFSSDLMLPLLDDSSHCKPMIWPYNQIGAVKIDAYIYTYNKSKKFGGINSNGRNLSKKYYLKFVAATNIKGNFEYYWQVVNTGAEARNAVKANGSIGDLRGNFFLGDQVHWEHTQYIGKHWVECFIIQNNFCVARSEKFFINIKN